MKQNNSNTINAWIKMGTCTNPTEDFKNGKCLVSGNTQIELFKNIEAKIWEVCGEIEILDEKISKEYNQWIADTYNYPIIPEIIENIFQKEFHFALPYSQDLKNYLNCFI